MDFVPFPKVPRLSREMVVSEKLDGTNASVYFEVAPPGSFDDHPNDAIERGWLYLPQPMLRMRVGSRTRWITPDDDNFGFARWAYENCMDLANLGPGHHFGEWWGRGIQRGYGLAERRFSLFNVSRWADPKTTSADQLGEREFCPDVCHVVPVLYQGPFFTETVNNVVDDLRHSGSRAAKGFMDPEGVMVWHEAARQMFKKTIMNDDKPKGKS